ncbi:MAG TPA: hypothetical protein VMF91_15155 [Bryobacteraceae bacterium]|nr:hypothetical protein [Bryobacteraceae bacterium]
MMRRTLGFFAGFGLAFAAFGAGSDIQLVSTQKITMPGQVSYGLEKWRHGHLISVDKLAADSATFVVSDAEDSGIEFSFSLPNTTRMWIDDFDLDARGAVVFCGQSYSFDGRLASFIGIREPAADQITVIRTYPYRPKVISVAPDGTVWTSGIEAEQTAGSWVVNQNADIVRHYDRSGRLIASAIPEGQVTYQPRTVSGFLVATKSCVGWYSPDSGKGNVYVEMSPDLRSVTQYPGIPDPHGYGRVLGFTLSESGDAYLTWEDQARRATYHLDRTLKQWIEIPVPQATKDLIPTLKGEDEGLLVFRDGYDLNFVKPVSR